MASVRSGRGDRSTGRARPSAPVGLYVHVPFCIALCPYCDFVVLAGAQSRGPTSRVDEFVRAMLVELELRADALDARLGRLGERGRRPLASLYFGGGTPSLLPSDVLASIVELIRRRYGLAPDAEVTLEANPAPGERGDPAAQRDAGVTRLSIGAQSFHADELRRLGRRHRSVDSADAVAGAREAGISSIGLDLLYDVPGQTLESWLDSLERAVDIGPDHLSLYALTLGDPDAEGLTGPLGDHLPVATGARRWRAGATAGQDEDRAAAMYHLAVHHLAEAGFRGYEISNWARPGHESRHNLAYWRRLPIEAVGPGAHAFDGVTRRWNAARLDAYVAALLPGRGGSPRLPPGGSERIDEGTAAAEETILGLRMDAGLPMDAIAREPLASVFAWALAEELIEIGGDERVRLTTRGRLLSNEVFARLV